MTSAAWLAPAIALALAVLTFLSQGFMSKKTALWAVKEPPRQAMTNKQRSRFRRQLEARLNRDADWVQLFIAVAGSLPGILFLFATDLDARVIIAVIYLVLIALAIMVGSKVSLSTNESRHPLLIASGIILLLALVVGIAISIPAVAKTQ